MRVRIVSTVSILAAFAFGASVAACRSEASSTRPPVTAASSAEAGPGAAKGATTLSPSTARLAPDHLATDEEMRARKAGLTPRQFEVTQHEGTEPPFHNDYWDEHRAGIYVDIVSGEPLFSSREKFESGTGWPSFYAPLDPDNVKSHEDTTLGMSRVEVRSKHADSHLGHVFDDGPAPTGQRYCINSASLRFVPAERLTIEGYGQYAALFPDVKQLAAPK